MSRTVETARILAGHCRLEPQTRDGLREISHGRWEGMTRADVEEQFRRGIRRRGRRTRSRSRPQGGESGVAVLARALPILRDIVVRHAGERVLVVSHKATIRLLLSSLLGFDARGYRDRLDQAPACLNVLDFKDAVHARLMLFNDTSHYAARPRLAEQNLSKWWDKADRN